MAKPIRIRKVVEYEVISGASDVARAIERARLHLELPAGQSPILKRLIEHGLVTERQFTQRLDGELIFREEFIGFAIDCGKDKSTAGRLWTFLTQRRPLGVEVKRVEATMLNRAGAAILAATYPQVDCAEWQRVSGVAGDTARILVAFRDYRFGSRAEG